MRDLFDGRTHPVTSSEGRNDIERRRVQRNNTGFLANAGSSGQDGTNFRHLAEEKLRQSPLDRLQESVFQKMWITGGRTRIPAQTAAHHPAK